MSRYAQMMKKKGAMTKKGKKETPAQNLESELLRRMLLVSWPRLPLTLRLLRRGNSSSGLARRL
jgi:hypothetical protein